MIKSADLGEFQMDDERSHREAMEAHGRRKRQEIHFIFGAGIAMAVLCAAAYYFLS